MGQANQLVAGVGVAMLLVGQFLPMLTLRNKESVSFVEPSWQALMVALAPREDKGNPNVRAGITVVVGIALLYPACIFGLVALTFLRICSGTSPDMFTVLGGLSLLATILYGVGLLALSTLPLFAITATSPGFGWAVVSLGGLVIIGAGMIRSDVRG